MSRLRTECCSIRTHVAYIGRCADNTNFVYFEKTLMTNMWCIWCWWLHYFKNRTFINPNIVIHWLRVCNTIKIISQLHYDVFTYKSLTPFCLVLITWTILLAIYKIATIIYIFLFVQRLLESDL